jgi:hypothetical protein
MELIIQNDGLYQLVPVTKADDGTYLIVGKSRLHGSVRDTKTKTDNVRRQFKSTCHE